MNHSQSLFTRSHSQTGRARAGAVRLIAALVVAVLAYGCARTPVGVEVRAPGRDETVRVLSYNVQNLFDDIDDGLEYEEFTSHGGWTRSAYYERLERLEYVIGGVGRPDIIALQEVESPRVALDLTRDFVRSHRHIASGATARSTTQVVVLSQTAPDSVRAHRAVVVEHVPGLHGGSVGFRWRGRDMVEVGFDRHALRVYAAHWKSQSGGERHTEPLRIAEALLFRGVLADRPRTRDEAVLLVGDLNEDLYEYDQHDGAWPTAIVPAGGTVTLTATGADVGADAGWTANGPEPEIRTLWSSASGGGTYFYRGAWERLDHAFLGAGPAWSGSLEVVSDPELLTETGLPARYQTHTGWGYSDHLPILVELRR